VSGADFGVKQCRHSSRGLLDGLAAEGMILCALLRLLAEGAGFPEGSDLHLAVAHHAAQDLAGMLARTCVMSSIRMPDSALFIVISW
jgi:hypothetical protein